MSGVVGKNEDRYSGQIAAVVGIETRSSDPLLSTVTEGTVWYNTVDRQLKVATQGSGADGAWSAGGNLGTAVGGCGGVGNPSSAMNVAGDTGSPISAVSAIASTYDGTSWTAINNQLTARTMPGSAGTVTAILIYGGRTATGESSYVSNVEQYDGTSWSILDSMNNARGNFASFGTQHACMRAGGGGSGSPTPKDDAELYDGAAWAATPVPDVRYKSGGAGTLSSGYMISGNHASGTTGSVRIWNGVTWADGPNIGTGRNECVGIGSTTATMAVGGTTGSTTVSRYDNVAWTVGPVLTTGRHRSSGGGTASYGLVAGGRNSSSAALTSTEEWNTNMTGVVIKQGLSNFTLRGPTGP